MSERGVHNISLEKIIAYKKKALTQSELSDLNYLLDKDDVLKRIVDDFDLKLIEDYRYINESFSLEEKSSLNVSLPKISPKVLMYGAIVLLTMIILAVIPYSKIFKKGNKNETSSVPIKESFSDSKALVVNSSAGNDTIIVEQEEVEVPVEQAEVDTSNILEPTNEVIDEVNDSIITEPAKDSVLDTQVSLPSHELNQPKTLPKNLFSMNLVSSDEILKKKGLFTKKNKDYIDRDIQKITDKLRGSINYSKGEVIDPKSMTVKFSIDKNGKVSNIKYIESPNDRLEAIVQNALFKLGSLPLESEYEVSYTIKFNYDAKK